MNILQSAKKWLSEPMVFFFLAGGIVFSLYSFTAEHDQERIIIDETEIAGYMEAREQVLGRSLRPEEATSLRKYYVDNEILIQEAVAMGLHLEDTRIRNRLAEKMYYLFDRDIPDPTMDQLRDYYDDHNDQFLTPPTISFNHYYFEEQGEALADASARLKTGELPEDSGDQFWLGARLEQYSAQQLSNLLGHEFVAAVEKLPIRGWSDPIKSSRGWHLVQVISRNDPRPLGFDETTIRVRNDWFKAQREQHRSEYLAMIKNNYAVEIRNAE